MLRHTALLCLVLGACAGRPQAPSTPRMYFCGGSRVTEHTDAVAMASTERTALSDADLAIGSQSCDAADPYDGVLLRYMRSRDLHVVASELHISEREARQLIEEAIHRLDVGIWHR